MSALRVMFNYLCWATTSGIEHIMGERLGCEVEDGW